MTATRDQRLTTGQAHAAIDAAAAVAGGFVHVEVGLVGALWPAADLHDLIDRPDDPDMWVGWSTHTLWGRCLHVVYVDERGAQRTLWVDSVQAPLDPADGGPPPPPAEPPAAPPGCYVIVRPDGSQTFIRVGADGTLHAADRANGWDTWGPPLHVEARP